MTQTRKSQLNR